MTRFSGITRKEVSGQPKSVLTEENIKLVEEIVLSQEDQRGINSTPAEIARELSIDRRSLSRVIDQDLDLHTLRKRKLQKLTDSNIEKFTVIHPRKLLSKYS